MRRLLYALILLLLANPAGAVTLQTLNLPVKDLVVHPETGVLYCSVSGTGGLLGNSIVRVNPATGDILGSTFVGSEPGALGLTADGSEIYVSLEGSATVLRYNTATQTAGIPFSLGLNRWGTPYLASMFVVPRSGPVVVGMAQTGWAPSIRQIGYLQGSTLLPGVGEFHTDSLFTSPIPQRQYGIDFYPARVASDGMGFVSSEGVFGGSSFHGSTAYYNGLIYSGTGQVVDAETGVLVATVAGLQYTWAALPDGPGGRIYYVDGFHPRVLKAYDLRTYQLVGSETLGNLEPKGRLVRWGQHGLAFATAQDQLVLLESDLVAAPTREADLELTVTPGPSPHPAGSPTTYGLTVTNHGPDPATGVVLHAGWERNVRLISATSSNGAVPAAYEGTAATRIGELPVGASVTVSVQLAFRRSGAHTLTACAQGYETDPTPADQCVNGQMTAGTTLGPELSGAMGEVKVKRKRNGKMQVTATLTVRNTGLGDAGPFTVRWIGFDPDMPDSPYGLGPTFTRIKKLKAGRQTTVRLSRAVVFSTGDYVGAILDSDEEVAEANERDNRVLTAEAVNVP